MAKLTKNATRIAPIAFGLSIGMIWGLWIFIIGLLAHEHLYGATFVETMKIIYVGYSETIRGSLLGGLLGFIDGFVAGFIIAWFYNLFANCGCKKK